MQPAYSPGSQEISPPSHSFPTVPAPAVVAVKPEGNSDPQVGGTTPVVCPPGAAPQAVPPSSGGAVQSSAVQQPARREPGGSAAVRPPRAEVKLMPFNGEGSLEMFLAKFENMSRYLEWNESDRFYHLCASLEGVAGQVLWDVGSQADTKSVLDLWRARFGTELQAERFKAELKAHRRRLGESLQHVYQDVCCLVALAYPSAGSALTIHVAREAFVTESEPKSVEDALNYATKQEAIETSLLAYGHTAYGQAGGQDKVYPGKPQKVPCAGRRE